MRIKTRTLISSDLKSVDLLMKRSSGTLGFLPFAALHDYLANETAIGAIQDDGSLVGYLIYSANVDRFRIVHLCVDQQFRRRGIASQLLEALKHRVTTQFVFQVTCRNDFPRTQILAALRVHSC